jgi:membrane protease subunit HflK
MQQILDSYNAGVEITQVQAQKSDPPIQSSRFLLEMFKLQKRIKSDNRMKLKLMQTMLFQRARGEAAKNNSRGRGL